jgi:hypothetical protein
MAVLRRWITPDVLLMSAIELGYPIQTMIQMKSNDFSGLALQLSLRLHDLPFAALIASEFNCTRGSNSRFW